MSFLGNVLWIVLGGGFILFIEYVIGGIFLCLTIIGIPFGLQMFKLSFLALFPFGKKIKEGKFKSDLISLIMNIIWILVGGIWISLTHLLFGFLCAITIIGIPFALQHLKLARLALTPFGTTFR